MSKIYVQFMNKVLYAREGARNIMDRTFEDFPWQVRVEVDGVDVEVPEVSNSNYMYIEMLFAFKEIVTTGWAFRFLDSFWHY